MTARLAVLTVVAHDDGVRLKCAGWVPQDDVSDVNVTAVDRRASRTSFVESRCGSKVLCRLVHSPRQRRITGPAKSSWLSVYMVASDQHQPDNSRATATLATKGFFFRSVKPCHLL